MTTTDPLPTGQELQNILEEALKKLDIMRGNILTLEARCHEKDKALSLAKSMILSGEQMSEDALQIFDEALS